MPDSDYTGYLKSKLVQCYQDALKSDLHAPSQEERGEEVDEDGGAEEGDASALGAMPDMDC